MKRFLPRQLPLALKLFFISVCFINSAEAFAQVIIPPPIPNIKAPSTTTITSSVNPSIAGQPVLLTATITSSAQGTPTGTVHFYDNTTNTDLTPSGIAISNGMATFTTAALTANASFTATYSGDGGNLGSTSAVYTQTVNYPIIIISPNFFLTTTTLVSNTNPSVAGSQPVTFTATVSTSGNANLIGMVDFWDNTNNTNLTPGGINLIDGVATFTTSSLPFGDLNITAVYRGDANGNQQSTSNSLIQRVQLNITGIGITLTANLDQGTSSIAGTTNWGDRITFTATVSTGIGAPSGTVTFTDNGYLLGTVTMDAAGKASITTNLLTPGSHTITASYLFITSNVLTHNVTPPFPPLPFGSPGAGLVPSQISLIHNVGYNVISDNELRFFFGNPSPYGKPITLAAFVSGLTGYTPTGSVLFQLIREFEVSDLGEVGLDAAGNALFTTSILPVGRYTIRAIYNGNDIYEPNANSKTIEIETSPTTTTISSNLNPSIAGQQITFTATVASPYPESNAITPGGDVIFNIDGVNQPPAPLTGNGVKAFLDISSLTPGNHTIKAHYPGDERYKGSTSGTITQVVEPVGSTFLYFLGDSQSTLVNTLFLNHIMFDIININPRLVGGASITFTAPASGASGTFSNGTNSITVNTTTLGSVGVADSGPFTANGIPGTYTVTATVPGMGTATFTMTNTAPPVQITVGISVPGLSFSVDGINYTASKTFNWEPGSSHTFTTTSPQSLAVGNQYTFTGWSDGTQTLSYSITVPSTSTSYTAEFECSQEWVLDKDLDNYYTGDPVVTCQSPGEGHVPKGNLKPGDCDDNDANINPENIWLLDVDGDGYHEKIYIALPSCTPPQDGRNYINNSKGQDCDDNDATYNPETVWVKDADGDGYYIGEPYTGCFFIFTPGYVHKTTQKPGDCDDNNAAINPETIWYKDSDGDGYSDALYISQPSCTSPGGSEFKLTIKGGGDCNDGDASINPETVWYLDADNDGYYIGSGITTCEVFLSGYKKSGLLGGGDCNDNDAAINPETIWYKDSDGDGYSDALYISQPSCTSPGGSEFKLTIKGGGDCNDGDASINPETVWYLDADNDGYYTGSGITTCEVFLSGYKKSGLLGGGDCNDNDAAINPETIWYKDSDGDGYSDALYISQPSCTSPGGSEFKLTIKGGGDCNDGDASINPETVWYLDADNDGYYTGSGITTCQVFLSGYKKSGLLGGGDCNDNITAIHPEAVEVCDGIDNDCDDLVDEGVKSTFYRDADGDGYGNPLVTTQACSVPAGYVSGNTDCNDNLIAIHPGATEVCDGIDNDCDGLIDEGVKLTFYKDADADGYGNAAISTQACSAPAGYVSNNTDCSDNDPTVNPGAVEVCGNGKDDNCNNVQNERGCYTCGNATGFSTTNITSNSATLNWVSIPNPNYWQVQYKSTKPGSKWVDVKPDPTGNKRSVQITGLSANQSYLWHVKARCGNSWTDYSVSLGFNTTSSVVLTRSALTTAEPDISISADNITVYPNPTTGIVNLNLQLKSMVTAPAVISLTDITGRTVYNEKTSVVKGILNTKIQIPASTAAGVYLMKIVTDGNSYQYRLVYAK